MRSLTTTACKFALLLCACSATRCGRATFHLLEDDGGGPGESGATFGGAAAGVGGSGDSGGSGGSGGSSGNTGGSDAMGGSGATSGSGAMSGSGLGGGGRDSSGGAAGRPQGPPPGDCSPDPSIRCTAATCERCSDNPQCPCDSEGWCTCTPDSCGKSEVCNPLARKCVPRCDTTDPNACLMPGGTRGLCTVIPGAPYGPTSGYCLECTKVAGSCERDLFCFRDQCVECRQNCDCWFRFGAREGVCSMGQCICREDRDCLGEDLQGIPFVCDRHAQRCVSQSASP